MKNSVCYHLCKTIAVTEGPQHQSLDGLAPVELSFLWGSTLVSHQSDNASERVVVEKDNKTPYNEQHFFYEPARHSAMNMSTSALTT